MQEERLCPENFRDWITHDYALRKKSSIEQMQFDLKKSTFTSSYSWIVKAKITSGMVEGTGRILDIGCGWGRETHRYTDSVGIDLCIPFLKTAKKYSDNHFIRASADYLPFKTGIFSHAIMTEVIEHLELPQQKKALTEVKRVLIPKGKLIVQTPNRCITRLRRGGVSKEYGHKNELNARELKTLLQNYHYKILKFTGSTIPYIPSDSRLKFLDSNYFFLKFWRLLNRLFSWLIKWDIIILAES